MTELEKQLLEALEYAIKQVPELATVPGIAAAIAAAAHQLPAGPVMHMPSGFAFDKVIAAANPSDLVALTPQESVEAAQPVGRDGYAQGVEAVAKMLEKKADDYARQYGHDDMGSLSFGGGWRGDLRREHHSDLLELADDVRNMLPDAQQPASTQPVAWYTDWHPDGRKYAETPHGFDDPHAVLNDESLIEGVWLPLYAAPQPAIAAEAAQTVEQDPDFYIVTGGYDDLQEWEGELRWVATKDDLKHLDRRASYRGGYYAQHPSSAQPVTVPEGLLALQKELGTLRWIGADEGWELAIEAVSKRISEMLSAAKKSEGGYE